MSIELALFFKYAGIFTFCLLVAVVILAFIFSRIDWPFEPSPEEIAAKEAERIAKQATKEFKQRQRLRTVRFFNF